MKSPTSLFIPKDYLTLQVALAVAEQAPQFSKEVDKFNSVIAWFRQELHAKSFSCSYFSVANKLKEIPHVVFADDESIGLFEFGKQATGVAEENAPEIDLAFLRRDNFLNDQYRTYTDQGPNSPYFISDELELARGKQLFISKMGFEDSLAPQTGMRNKNYVENRQSRQRATKSEAQNIVAHRPPHKREETISILRQLDPSQLEDKRESLLSIVNAKATSKISKDTLRRALLAIQAEA